MTVGSCPPSPYAAGPGAALADRGPTRNAPPSSTHPTDPPPALTVCTSTMGSRSGTPATTDSVVSCTRPATTGATSVLVPPMSKVSRFR